MPQHDQSIDSVDQLTVPPLLLSSAAAAQFLSVSQRTLWEFSQPGRLLAPAVRRFGRRVLYHVPTIERVLSEAIAVEDPNSEA
jgi:hypothetical protein